VTDEAKGKSTATEKATEKCILFAREWKTNKIETPFSQEFHRSECSEPVTPRCAKPVPRGASPTKAALYRKAPQLKRFNYVGITIIIFPSAIGQIGLKHNISNFAL